MTGGAAGRVLLNGQDRGSGFAIADTLALTAGHVVWGEKRPGGGRRPAAGPPGPAVVYLVDRGEPAAAAAVVEYQPEGGEPIPVTRVEVSTGLDVAVLHLQRPAPAVLPAAGQVTAEEPWRVDTRPDPGAPVLRGTVTEPHRQLQNAAGKETTLIQLWVEQAAGGYQGYSGSPVIAQSAGGVLGVLVEQGRWRTGAQLGEKPPVGNWLFAAPLDQVVAEFDLAGVPVARSVRDVPRPVSFEIPRPDQLNQVMDALIGASPDGQLVALVGMPGTGKSVLAAAAAREKRVKKAFKHGRFWLELGPDPPLLRLQASLAAALGDSRPITDVPQGRARLSRLLAEHKYLLVLDNVWDQAHVPAFAEPGPPCRVLVTTRDTATIPRATVVPLGQLSPEAATGLLARWARLPPGDSAEEADLVARACGYLPLALAVCGALIDAGSHNWRQLLDLLSEADLDALPIRFEDYPQPSLAFALAASIDTLPPDTRDRYLQLAVFEGQGPVPAAAVQVLGGLDQQHASTLIDDLAHKSLLRAEAGQISLHDLQMDYLTRRAPDQLALHNQLLAAYRDQCPAGWASGPDDGYFFQHLAGHLHQAARIPELKALLLDLDWMTAKLATGTISGLLADYDTLPADPAMRLVAGALRLSAHVLADHPGQLPSQLTGRLAGQPDPQLRDLLQRARSWSATPWLRPLTASLAPSGGPLQLTLADDDCEVLAVAVSADGRRAVSGGRSVRGYGAGTVRVWDLDTGDLLRTLAGHDRQVSAVAVSADGRRAISGGYALSSGTVLVWDLDTGDLLHTLAGGVVNAVAVSADGRRAISGGAGASRVWDLDTGELLRTLASDDHEVSAVAVSADGRRAVSAGGAVRMMVDPFLIPAGPRGRLVRMESRTRVFLPRAVRVWDLDTGELLRTVASDDAVHAVAVSSDGRRAVSGGYGTVRVWDLDTGELLRTLASHDRKVSAVAASADGRRAVSGGNALIGGEVGTVQVWDTDTGDLLRTLASHDRKVSAVAVSADGRRAVSGGNALIGGGGGTVQVWDTGAGDLLPKRDHTLADDDRKVSAVAVSADGRHAISGHSDGTVRMWDLDTGNLLHTLTSHGGEMSAVAVSADGGHAISGHSDGTVRMWDLDTGNLLHTLTSHNREVSAVAVSADGGHAISGYSDGVVRVWDLDTGNLLHTLASRDMVRAVAVSADGRRAICIGSQPRVWDLTTGKWMAPASQRLRHWFRRRTARSPVGIYHRGYEIYRRNRAAISADGHRAVSEGSGTIRRRRYLRVWDLDTGKRLRTLPSDDHEVSAVAVTADGRRAVFGYLYGAVRVWDLDTGKRLRTLAGHSDQVSAVAVSADGRRAVSHGYSDGVVRVWDLEEGVEFAFFASDNKITEMAVSAAGTRVIAGTSADLVHLLELCGYEYASGQPPAQEPRP